MKTVRSIIQITVEYNNELHLLQAHPHEYRSLMHFIFDRIYIEDFGDCRGMGRCGTCLVEIINPENSATGFERNEQATLERLGETKSNTRLACQILVDDRINHLQCRVILPESLGF